MGITSHHITSHHTRANPLTEIPKLQLRMPKQSAEQGMDLHTCQREDKRDRPEHQCRALHRDSKGCVGRRIHGSPARSEHRCVVGRVCPVPRRCRGLVFLISREGRAERYGVTILLA
mmetsp:Transcript_328/g.608  ORF Transcript_328/g.608 Transcript_328/m.608 type:complete len:117 (+) Transcript_328:157-507(+)